MFYLYTQPKDKSTIVQAIRLYYTFTIKVIVKTGAAIALKLRETMFRAIIITSSNTSMAESLVTNS